MNEFNCENTNRLWSSFLIHQLCQNGITHFYISPGMRNAPLIYAIESNPLAQSFDGIDERSISYRALSYSKASGKPAVLVCTSGSAALNYSPALLESKHDGGNLLVISADRPFEKIHTDANQTTDQNSFFGSLVDHQYLLDAPSKNINASDLNGVFSTLIKNLLNGSNNHLNFPFRGPLDHTPEENFEEYLEEFNHFNSSKSYYQSPLGHSIDEELIHKIQTSKNPLISIGKIDNLKDEEKDLWIKFLKKTKAAKIVDITSSLKWAFSLDDGVIPSPDHPEVLKYLQNNPPDLLIHFGGRLTSKYFYQLFKDKDIAKILFQGNENSHNPEGIFNHFLTLNLNGPPELKITSQFQNPFKELESKKSALIEDGPLSTPFLSKTISDSIDGNLGLFIGNSTLIRSFDNYTSNIPKCHAPTLSHRGVSGIEGHIASVCGLSDALGTTGVLGIIGDISFLHDLNGLWHLKDSTKNITIIVANNKGGGIFNLLPIKKSPDTLKHMTTEHNIEFAKTCEAFGIQYKKCQSKEEISKYLNELPKNTGVQIIEVLIDENLNQQVFEELKTLSL